MSETNVTLPEAPFSANTRFVDRDGYDWQMTIRAASLDELITHISEVKSKVLKNFQPAGHRTPAATNGNAPTCPTHGKPMKESSKKAGTFYCPEKVAEDGGDGKPVYCKHKA